MLGFSCKKKKFVYDVNEQSIPQVTNSPMYNIASAVTCRTLAIVLSLPLPECDIDIFINRCDIYLDSSSIEER